MTDAFVWLPLLAALYGYVVRPDPALPEPPRLPARPSASAASCGRATNVSNTGPGDGGHAVPGPARRKPPGSG